MDFIIFPWISIDSVCLPSAARLDELHGQLEQQRAEKKLLDYMEENPGPAALSQSIITASRVAHSCFHAIRQYVERPNNSMTSLAGTLQTIINMFPSGILKDPDAVNRPATWCSCIFCFV
jgi:hypothetical protein